MNLLAMLPSILSGKMNPDDLAKQLGLIKRSIDTVHLQQSLLLLCEDSVRAGVEVIEVTGVIGGKRIRCVLVAEPVAVPVAQKKVLEG